MKFKFPSCLALILASLALTACGALQKAERRPFADEVRFMALQPAGKNEPKKIGETTAMECQAWLFGIVPLSEEPSFEQLKHKMVREQGIVYLENATTYRMNKGYMGVWTDNCIYLKGVAYR
ncbi:MAG: hypothetical protein AB7F86_14735 [Bdellovibrionales bacterium]